MERSNRILNTIREMFPDAGCELNYSNLFELIIAVSLSAQTTDKRVNIVTKELFSKYPTPESLGNAKYSDVYEIIKSLGLAKTKASNIIKLSKILVEKYDSKVPSSRSDMESLPGVGRKTTNVMLMEGFKVPAIAVDTHVSRVSQRLGLSKESDVRKIEDDLMKEFDPKDWYYVHHGLLFFGRYHCLAKKPNCGNCPLRDLCVYEEKDGN